jgi:SAM-dependent methyltransferase
VAADTDEPGNSLGRATIGGAEGGWWARERDRFIVERLRRNGIAGGLVVDVGCGRGELEPVLAEGLGAFVVGCDGWRSPTWRNVAGRCAFVVGDARALPLRAGVADVVAAFEVLEHFADDQVPLAAMLEVAAADGRICATVPAGPGLWSPFDEAVGHFRRYRPDTVVAAFTAAGLRTLDVTAYFAWLVPPAWLLRRRTRHDADEAGDGLLGRFVAAAVAVVARAERAVLRRRRLRIGTSLWVLAERPAGPVGTPRVPAP